LGKAELWGSGCLDTKDGFPEADNNPESNFWSTWLFVGGGKKWEMNI